MDVCAECGGVWLDRGELDKLMSADEPAVLASSNATTAVQDGDQSPPPPEPPKAKKPKKSKKKKKPKKGWADQLEDILDDVLDLDDLFD